MPLLAHLSVVFSVPGPGAQSEGRGGQADEAGPAESPESVQLCRAGAALREGEEPGPEEAQQSPGPGKTQG